MVSVSDGKGYPELSRLRLTMELLILQKVDTSTPSTSIGPPTKASNQHTSIEYLHLYVLY